MEANHQLPILDSNIAPRSKPTPSGWWPRHRSNYKDSYTPLSPGSLCWSSLWILKTLHLYFCPTVLPRRANPSLTLTQSAFISSDKRLSYFNLLLPANYKGDARLRCYQELLSTLLFKRIRPAFLEDIKTSYPEVYKLFKGWEMGLYLSLGCRAENLKVWLVWNWVNIEPEPEFIWAIDVSLSALKDTTNVYWGPMMRQTLF